MIAQPVAMVAYVDDDGVFPQTGFLQRDQQPTDLVIDQRDLAIGVGDDLAQLGVGLLSDTAVILADLGGFRTAGGPSGPSGSARYETSGEGIDQRINITGADIEVGHNADLARSE